MKKMFYLFKACGRCNGDLTLNEDEWACIQCGRRYYPKSSMVDLSRDLAASRSALSQDDSTGGPPEETNADHERTKVRRPGRHIGAKHPSNRFDEAGWWRKNQQIIGYLDQGKKVSEIAQMVGGGTRQIRLVRERLHDLRFAEADLVTAN